MKAKAKKRAVHPAEYAGASISERRRLDAEALAPWPPRRGHLSDADNEAPDEDDLTTKDRAKFYQGGKLVLTLERGLSVAGMWTALDERMRRAGMKGFLPNVWNMAGKKPKMIPRPKATAARAKRAAAGARGRKAIPLQALRCLGMTRAELTRLGTPAAKAELRRRESL